MSESRYELWDMPTDTLVVAYDTAEETWAAIVERAEAGGIGSLERLALVLADTEPDPEFGLTVKIVLSTGPDILGLAQGNIEAAKRPVQFRTPKSERNERRLRECLERMRRERQRRKFACPTAQSER